MIDEKKPKNLDDLIKKYPKIFILLNEFFYRISSDLPKGWVDIIDTLCNSLQSRTDNITIYEDDKEFHPPQIEVTQIKEKFGGLRLYTRGGDDEMQGMIEMAEDMCWEVCEFCGSNENIITTKGWISRVCKKCKND